MRRPPTSAQFTICSGTIAARCSLPSPQAGFFDAAVWAQPFALPRCPQLYVQGCQQQDYGQDKAALRAFRELLIIGQQVGHQGWINAAQQAITGLSAELSTVVSDTFQNPTPNADLTTAEQCDRAALLHTQGAWEKAIQAYQVGLATATQAGHYLAMGHCLNGLGLIYCKQQRFALAETRFRAAVAVLADVDMPMLRAIASHNLGLAHYQQGQYESAKAAFQTALADWQTHEDCLGLALTLDYLGRVYAQQGESWLALGSFEAAIDVLNNLSVPQDIHQAAAALMLQIAALCQQQQHLYLAITYLHEILAIYQDLSTMAPCVIIWQTLSKLYAQTGHPAIARHYAQSVCQACKF